MRGDTIDVGGNSGPRLPSLFPQAMSQGLRNFDSLGKLILQES